MSTLASQLATQIMSGIASGDIRLGDRITERGLAEWLRVSRSPVRRALDVLEAQGVVTRDASGAVVTAVGDAASLPTATTDDDLVYYRIASDRLAGALPERVTENELSRRYVITRVRLGHILRRIAEEGWIERLPGHGWAFLPVLTSIEAYEDAHRFRTLIEPAAVLEPRFVLDEATLMRVREQQVWLAEGAIFKIGDMRLFDLNSALHQAIMACCRNAFLIDSLKRIDRLRRLIDYRQMLDRETARARSLEHVAIVDALLAGERKHASHLLRSHLERLPALKRQFRGGIDAARGSSGHATE